MFALLFFCICNFLGPVFVLFCIFLCFVCCVWFFSVCIFVFCCFSLVFLFASLFVLLCGVVKGPALVQEPRLHHICRLCPVTPHNPTLSTYNCISRCTLGAWVTGIALHKPWRKIFTAVNNPQKSREILVNGDPRTTTTWEQLLGICEPQVEAAGSVLGPWYNVVISQIQA